jgi:Spy/CpxP family protein refolding chaperone
MWINEPCNISDILLLSEQSTPLNGARAMASRKITVLSLGGFLAIIVVTAGAWAHSGTGAYGSGYGMGPGMMSGHGMMHAPGMMGGEGMMHGPGIMGMGPVWMLDLTGEQHVKINALRDELRKKRLATMGQIMGERGKLFEIYSADSLDAKKVGEVYGRIFDLRRQMIEAVIDTRNRTQALLTEEQRIQLDQWRHGWRAGPGMMGPGMMGPGPRHGMGG